MNSSWQASQHAGNDVQPITFYNPQAFQQGQYQNQDQQHQTQQLHHLQHPTYNTQLQQQQSERHQHQHFQHHQDQQQQQQQTQPAYHDGQTNYQYQSHYGQAPVPHYNGTFQLSQMQDENWNLNQDSGQPYHPYQLADSTGSYANMNFQSQGAVPETTGHSNQPYNDPFVHSMYDETRQQSGIGMIESGDEMLTSRGDWDDIELDRDPGEYESSSSSSEYDPGIRKHPVTDYTEEYENNSTLMHTRTNEQCQHPYDSQKYQMNQGCDSFLEGVGPPINPNIHPPQPLPESLTGNFVQPNLSHSFSSTQGHTHQTNWFEQRTEPNKAITDSFVADVTCSVGNLTISSGQASAMNVAENTIARDISNQSLQASANENIPKDITDPYDDKKMNFTNTSDAVDGVDRDKLIVDNENRTNAELSHPNPNLSTQLLDSQSTHLMSDPHYSQSETHCDSIESRTTPDDAIHKSQINDANKKIAPMDANNDNLAQNQAGPLKSQELHGVTSGHAFTDVSHQPRNETSNKHSFDTRIEDTALQNVMSSRVSEYQLNQVAYSISEEMKTGKSEVDYDLETNDMSSGQSHILNQSASDASSALQTNTYEVMKQSSGSHQFPVGFQTGSNSIHQIEQAPIQQSRTPNESTIQNLSSQRHFPQNSAAVVHGIRQHDNEVHGSTKSSNQQIESKVTDIHQKQHADSMQDKLEMERHQSRVRMEQLRKQLEEEELREKELLRQQSQILSKDTVTTEQPQPLQSDNHLKQMQHDQQVQMQQPKLSSQTEDMYQSTQPSQPISQNPELDRTQNRQSTPIKDQRMKPGISSDQAQTKSSQHQRKQGRQPGGVKASDELRQIMSNMRTASKKPDSLSSGRVASRQSSITSEKNSVENSDILSASRVSDNSYHQFWMSPPYGMNYYGLPYSENQSRTASEYGASDRPPSRASLASDADMDQQRRQDMWYQQWQSQYQYQQWCLAYHQWYSQHGNAAIGQGDAGYSTFPYYQGYPGYQSTTGWPTADQTNLIDPTGRRTPCRYTSPHNAVSLSLAGIVVQVTTYRPDEGEPALVQFTQMPFLEKEKEQSFYATFPGPLKRNGTIPSDVRAFLRMKREDIERRMPADRESVHLLIAYLELLVKNRGTVLGIDVVDLLLEGHQPRTKELRRFGPLQRATSYESLASLPPSGRSSPFSGGSSTGIETGLTEVDLNVIAASSMDKALDDYRKLLLCGRKRQALHYACKHALWGHALYLAHEMGPDILESTRSRFTKEAMQPHDPLQTFYQFSGRRMPEVSTNYLTTASSSWGDWRPHLAMLVANQEENPKLAAEAIIQLGDSLRAEQLLFASQLCYLLGGCDFGTLKDKNAKISMIGIDHRRSQENHVITDEAIQLTEIFEYAMGLAHKNFCIPSLQVYKFIYATRLLDTGLIEECYEYCEVLGSHLIRNPQFFSVGLGNAVFNLADRLQNHPACFEKGGGDWIKQLRILNMEGQFGTALDEDGKFLYGNVHSNTAPQQHSLNEGLGPKIAQPMHESNFGHEQQQMTHRQSQENYLQQQQHQQHHQQQFQQPNYQEDSSKQMIQHPSSQHESVSHIGYQTQHPYGSDVSSHTQKADAQSSHTYQHHDVVTNTIHEQTPLQNTHRNSPSPADNITYNPMSQNCDRTATMQFFNPGAMNTASDSAPPSPCSVAQPSGAFDYFSNIPQAYTRQSPSRSRTTSVASSGGQRSRHSSTAEHPNMPPPSRPHPTKGMMPHQETSQQGSNAQESNQDHNVSDGNNKRDAGFGFGLGMIRKIFSKNEVHLPDDKNPIITYDPQKGVWVNNDPEDEKVITAPPKLNQIPNPGENRFRSSRMGRGPTARYVDPFASAKTSAAPDPSMLPMLPPQPGQSMAGSGPPTNMVQQAPQPRQPGMMQPQFFVPGPPPPTESQ